MSPLDIHTDGLKGYERRQVDRERQYLEQQSLLEQIEAHAGGIASAMKAPPTGDVLYQGTVIIGAQGSWTLAWPVPYLAVAIGNTSTASLVVMAGPPSATGSPPVLGAGLFTVPGGILRTVSLRGRAITVYGPVGTLFDITLYSRPREPNAGPLGLQGGNIPVAGDVSGTVGAVTVNQSSGPQFTANAFVLGSVHAGAIAAPAVTSFAANDIVVSANASFIIFRPNGNVSTVGQVYIDTSGVVTLASLGGTATGTTPAAGVSTPVPVSGTPFTPNATRDAMVYVNVAGGATGGLLTVTMGPTTGAENTIVAGINVAGSTGLMNPLRVPNGWKVIVTVTGTVTIGTTTAVTC